MPYKDRISGIYRITNVKNNKFYIGSSINILKRFTQHTGFLRKGNHPNPHLQNSWNKYGKEAFRFEIVSKCPDDYVEKLEQWFIDNMKPDYNVCIEVGKSRRGLPVSKKSIQKRLTTLVNSGKILKPIYEYDLQGNFVRQWDSVKQIAHAKSYTSSCIRYCLTGKSNKCKSSMFSYEKVDKLPEYTFKRPEQCWYRTIYKKDKSGNILKTYTGLKECSIDLGIKRSVISQRVFHNNFSSWDFVIEYEEHKPATRR